MARQGTTAVLDAASKILLLLVGAFLLVLPVSAIAGYRQPPDAVTRLVDSAPQPSVEISANAKTLAILEKEGLPPIAQIARPTLQLGGIRIDPATNGPAERDVVWFTGLTLVDVETGRRTEVRLPQHIRFFHPTWSPDGRHLAFVVREDDHLALWAVDLEGNAGRLGDLRLNAGFGHPFIWMPDSLSIVARAVAAGRGPAPLQAEEPDGPIIEEGLGVADPERPYRGLLRTAHDDALFSYYFSAQLLEVNLDGRVDGKALPQGLVDDFSISPDGRFLLVRSLKPPFSRSAPAGRFPMAVEVWTRDGNLVKTLVDRAETEPRRLGFDAVMPGMRAPRWRSDRPADLVWVEAQDDGDPERNVTVRDRVYQSSPPFTDEPMILADLPGRFGGIFWGNDAFALVYSFSWKDRLETRLAIDPSRPSHIYWSAKRNYQAAYDNPGNPVLTVNASGHPVMRMHQETGIFLAGRGASPVGEQPFLAIQDIASAEIRRIWSSGPDAIESVAAVTDSDRIVTRRQSRDEAPNLYLRSLSGKGEISALTDHADPMPDFAGVSSQPVSYRRDDGLPLSGTLHLPPGYDPKRDGRLPLLIWVYPIDYADAESAGQTVGSGNRFLRPQRISPLFLVMQGYAVLERPSMPIVARDGRPPNDSYLAQLRANARAAIDKLVEIGVADRKRIAVGGHSYGAFTAANLAAHTDFFRAAIALSGAYNRSLTPFGFQAEERTYWQAPELYHAMSPFSAADRIDTPILLIHGGDDENAGTHPLQSQRFFAALKGLGAVARYVELPHEGHGFRARESILHILAEEIEWLDRHLRQRR